MKKTRAALMIYTFCIAIAVLCGGCGQVENDTGKTADPPVQVETVTSETPNAPTQVEMTSTSVTPIPQEEVGDDRYFNGSKPISDIKHGSFEDYAFTGDIPPGWQAVQAAPTCERETDIVKFGRLSVKLTGATDGEVRRIAPADLPPIEEIRGKEVIFGAWVYTSSPENTGLQIIDSWKFYNDVKATKTNEWELVIRRATISENATVVRPSIKLNPSNPPVVCYVDGAAFLVRDKKSE